VRHPAYQIGRHVHVVDFLKMSAYLPVGHPASVHRDDLTGVSTILSMIPLAFFPGAGAEMIQPIGLTFVGGLSVSFFMTLFVVPVMYSLLNSRGEKRRLRRLAAEGLEQGERRVPSFDFAPAPIPVATAVEGAGV